MKRKITIQIILIFVLSCLFIPHLSAQNKTASANRYMQTSTLDVNNIIAPLNNIGSLMGKMIYWDAGDSTEEERLNPEDLVYDHGLTVVGKIDGSLNLAGINWWNSYSPGPIINDQPALQAVPYDSLRYRAYKINRWNSNTKDYREWPADLGAPMQNNKPLIKGDQAVWMAYNAYDADQFYWWGIKPMPLEIHQYTFGKIGDSYSMDDFYSNIIFFEWTIINKGTKSIDSAFFSFWTDIDFFQIHYNYPSVDTVNQVGYCYCIHDDLNDSYYKGVPPALGYVLLYGPKKYAPGKTAVSQGKIIENYENLDLFAFHAITDDGPDHPSGLTSSGKTMRELWNYANGLDDSSRIIIDPVTNEPTKFTFSGDPVRNEGWLYPDRAIGGGAGFRMSAGPVDFAPADTQWIMIALVPAQGNNALNSIEVLREKAAKLLSLPYDSLTAPSNYAEDPKHPIIVINDYKLSQNYPNPFNSMTTIQYDLPFESFVRIEVFDILGRSVRVLFNDNQFPGKHNAVFDAAGLTSGVYIYKIDVTATGVVNSFTDVKKLILLK